MDQIYEEVQDCKVEYRRVNHYIQYRLQHILGHLLYSTDTKRALIGQLAGRNFPYGLLKTEK